MSPTSKTDFELDALIKEYTNRKDITEPERNRRLVVLRATREALTEPQALPEAFAAMVICSMEREDSKPSSRNSISVSWKDGVRASGPWAVAAASILLLAGLFVFAHKDQSRKMENMSEQISEIRKMVK